MKILFYSDFYAHNVMGTKRSIFDELIRRKHDVVFEHIKGIKNIIATMKFCRPDQIWFAHSGLQIPSETKKKIRSPIVGFGFSDPYYFSEKRLRSYDAYITYHFATFERLKEKIPTLYCQTACDLSFHKNMELMRDIDISMMGVAHHQRFRDPERRIKYVDRLRKETNFQIFIGGRGWKRHPHNLGFIEGTKFLVMINRSRIGLDIQESHSPIAHKIMEYSACGTPSITRERDEISRVFEIDKEILIYKDYGDLKEKLLYYLKRDPDELSEIGMRAQKRCIKDHQISNRIDRILGYLEGIFQ